MTPHAYLARLRAIAAHKKQSAELARQQSGLRQEEIAADLLREAWALDWAIGELTRCQTTPKQVDEVHARG